MSVFEDLIGELKRENLIEETVIELSGAEKKSLLEENNAAAITLDQNSPVLVDELPVGEAAKVNSDDETEFLRTAASQTFNEADFYRRRAAEEVSALQIVEHIFSGVEREQIKTAPKAFNHIPVSVALHDFLQITDEPDSETHSLAEFTLMQETETWYSALSQRDKFITVADLRRYCELACPALSAQALIALARFYRNAPYSELIRSKFDFIVTRLVTRGLNDERREILFERKELIERLKELYADWSSIPLYADDNDPEVLIAALKFQDFINEMKTAETFEALVKNDFFNRLRDFKDNLGEDFFSPLLTATTVECNVIVGNRYVDLIAEEREKNNTAHIEEKYNSLLDQVVSDVTSKTLQLVNLLKERKGEFEEQSETAVEEPAVNIKKEADKPESFEKFQAPAVESKTIGLRINKWLLAVAAIVLAAIGGLYVWVEHFAEAAELSKDVVKVSFDDSELKEYFKAARINDGTNYIITQSGWKDVPKNTKTDVLKKILADGAQKGYTRIHLLDGNGKTVGFASGEKGIELNGF